MGENRTQESGKEGMGRRREEKVREEKEGVKKRTEEWEGEEKRE